MTVLKVAIDCDDAATELKAVITEHLNQKGVNITDLNYSMSKEFSYYPEIALTWQKKSNLDYMTAGS
jgi:ribose 5-phosphate isomerase B